MFVGTARRLYIHNNSNLKRKCIYSNTNSVSIWPENTPCHHGASEHLYVIMQIANGWIFFSLNPWDFLLFKFA